MPRFLRRLAAASCAVGLATAALASCATESHGVDVSGDWVAQPGVSAVEPEASLLVFGDSWTFGLASTTVTGGYAYRTGAILGWATTVNGENGSGYLRAGEYGGYYGTRVAELDPDLDPDVVVIQGSINDRAQPLSALPRAARAVWRAVEATYPDAELVILGPAPSMLPVNESIESIDDVLAELAAEEGLSYISPIDDEWITTSNYDTVIDASASGYNHPSDDGHAYLAEKLVSELQDTDTAAHISARK
ncbi:MAG: SGNH/GDSL hydrolase family protein [Microbacterium gubbeenense]